MHFKVSYKDVSVISILERHKLCFLFSGKSTILTKVVLMVTLARYHVEGGYPVEGCKTKRFLKVLGKLQVALMCLPFFLVRIRDIWHRVLL